jgi:hypothetical protein
VPSPSELPPDVLQLLRERIRSIEQLEILLLLRESEGRLWTSGEVYKQVRSSERSVEQTLQGLCGKGLLFCDVPTSRYRFEPQTEALKTTIDQLAHLYAERRVRVVEAIYSEPLSAVDEFARAFRLRKDNDA